MEKEFVPYDLALDLKELGFDEPCFGIYYNKTKEFVLGKIVNEYTLEVRTWCPLYQQAFRWFREKYKSNFIIGFGNDGGYYRIGNLFSKWYKTYEEAELECLKKLIEIVKQK